MRKYTLEKLSDKGSSVGGLVILRFKVAVPMSSCRKEKNESFHSQKKWKTYKKTRSEMYLGMSIIRTRIVAFDNRCSFSKLWRLLYNWLLIIRSSKLRSPRSFLLNQGS